MVVVSVLVVLILGSAAFAWARTGTDVSVASNVEVGAPGGVEAVPRPPGTADPSQRASTTPPGSRCEGLRQLQQDLTTKQGTSRQELATVVSNEPDKAIDVSISFDAPLKFDDLDTMSGVKVTSFTIALFPFTQNTTLYGDQVLVRRGKSLDREQVMFELKGHVKSSSDSAQGGIDRFVAAGMISKEQAAAEQAKVDAAKARVEAGDLAVVRIQAMGAARDIGKVTDSHPSFAVSFNQDPAQLPEDQASRDVVAEACVGQ